MLWQQASKNSLGNPSQRRATFSGPRIFQNSAVAWSGFQMPCNTHGPQGQQRLSHQLDKLGEIPCSWALVIFPDTSLSRGDCSSAHCLSPCHACLGTQQSQVSRSCPQPLCSGQAQLHFLWPYQTLCFENS